VADVDEGYFTVRFERVTGPREPSHGRHGGARRRATAVRPGAQAARYAETGQTSLARGNLIEKGLICSPAYGLVELTVPNVADFMRRNYPLDRGESPSGMSALDASGVAVPLSGPAMPPSVRRGGRRAVPARDDVAMLQMQRQ
jgi:hypothetical protein